MDAQTTSVIALVLSLLSLGFSAYFGLRDRASLKAKSAFHTGWEGSSPSLSITIVNAGRRPVVLRLWAGADADGNWVGSFFADQERGLRLEEHDRHDLRLRKDDLFASTPDDVIEFVDIWIEDTLGRKHKVKGVKANITKLLAA